VRAGPAITEGSHRDASFIEGRIAFLLVYAVIIFEFRRQFAPNNSFKPNPLRGAA